MVCKFDMVFWGQRWLLFFLCYYFPTHNPCLIWITNKKTSAKQKHTSYLGSIGVRASLEVNDTIGVSGASLCVFFHRPLLQLRRGPAGALSRPHVRVLVGQAGREANVLPHQTPAAAPAPAAHTHAVTHQLNIYCPEQLLDKKNTLTIWKYFHAQFSSFS